MSWFFVDADEIEYYLPSFSLVSYVKRITHMSRVGVENVAHSCPLWTGIPTPLVLGVEVGYVPKT